MTRVGALIKLAEGLQADHAAFGHLHELLEAQFQAALRHRSEELSGLSDRITALCAEIEARRAERVTLVDALVPASQGDVAARIRQILAALPAPHADAALAAWQTLERQIHECKALNARNCKLMMDQFDIMQRVLATGDETYAPA